MEPYTLLNQVWKEAKTGRIIYCCCCNKCGKIIQSHKNIKKKTYGHVQRYIHSRDGLINFGSVFNNPMKKMIYPLVLMIRKKINGEFEPWEEERWKR